MKIAFSLNGSPLYLENKLVHFDDERMLSLFSKLKSLPDLISTIRTNLNNWVINSSTYNMDYHVSLSNDKVIIYSYANGGAKELKENLPKLVSFDYKGGSSHSYVIKPEKECDIYLEGRDVMDENQYKKFRKDGITNRKVILK